ncbi:MAG TPA: S16 family serine protease [Microbacteriaceae bacterium]|nr:S16 family serine protease [Microbacteriaceae bacterium]
MYLSRKERNADQRAPLGQIIGGALLGVAAVCTGVVAAMPAPYVIEYPGPVFDVLGQTTSNGEDVPMISIPVEETYPTEGALRLLTVYATPPQRMPSWIDVVLATFDPQRAVLPAESVYPPGLTQEQNAEQAKVEMANSQLSAIAAALHALGYELELQLSVAQVQEGAAAEGLLEVGDVIRSINGVEPATLEELRAAITSNGTSRPAQLVVQRGEAEIAVEATPRLSEPTAGAEPTPVLGILVASDFVLPFTVTIQLDNVGGPSAGMMFALGIYDKLTPGGLTGGEDIAGTGTIDAMGRVGAIGGIQQKMWGAVDAGAAWFLAPVDNCDEVVGSVPEGLRVFAVSTLDEAIRAVEVIGTGGDLDALPSCESVLRS